MLRTDHRRERKGMAIATALVAIVLIGALVAGTFFVATQDYRVGRSALGATRSLTTAENGQNMILNDWNLSWNQNMKTGDTVKKVYTTESGATDTVTVTRLRTNMFWVVSSGRMDDGGASQTRRRTGLLVRLYTPTMPFPGALSGALTTSYAGNSSISGTDAAPSGWTDCPPTQDPVAAIADVSMSNIVQPTSNGNNAACANNSCLSGASAFNITPDAGDTTKILDGWASLVSQADKVIDVASLPTTGGVPTITQIAPTFNANGTCKTTDLKNWGDPWRSTPAGACENYFPIVYFSSAVKGSLGLTVSIASGGRGQGIMLVDGNLSVSGNFEWTGPIVVRGKFSTSGTGNKITGGVEALDLGCTGNATATGACNQVSGNPIIQYSSCAISKALSMKAYPVVAKQHAWADMF